LPNIWTHMLFGEKLIQDWKDQLPPIEKHKPLFHLGCQGPDFLFYHHFLPWQRDRRMPQLGNRMHCDHCGPVLIDFFSKVKDIREPALRDQALAYFLGFLTHHILDRNFHPYIHFKAGYQKWDHQRFEIILDTLMLQQMKELATWETPVWKEIDAGSELPASIVEILRHTTSKWYEEAKDLSAHMWQDAYRDMIRAQKLFHDPYGWKRWLTLGRIEPMVYKKRNTPIDYLNEAKAAWNHPAVETESYEYSVWDLWEQSLEDGRNVLLTLLDWLSADEGKPEAKQRFKEALANISYDTGKDCESGFRNRFAQPIWFSEKMN
jgi:hypothetical protein